mgnify:CR=1 FL=1
MRKLVAEFPLQVEEAIAIAKTAELNKVDKKFQNLVISGLGGSGIGGTIGAQLALDQLSIPSYVNKDYHLPSFVNGHSLVVLCSYSGNTEETLSAFEEAESKGAELVCITSGGKLLEIAKNKGINHIQIPAEYPPRAAFGLSFTQLLKVLEHYNLIDSSLLNQMEAVPAFLRDEEESIQSLANEIADKFMGKTPILYCAAENEGVAVRFRQQINENGKMLCWHHVYPEMTHNELVGWTIKNEDQAVLFMRTSHDHIRTQKRMDITKEVYAKYTSSILDHNAKGSNKLEQSIYWIHLGDWVSVMLAEKRGLDPVEVDVITHLKGELAKFES